MSLADAVRRGVLPKSQAVPRAGIGLVETTSERANTSAWPELLFAILAMTGVLISILAGFHPREWQASGSDLKTLYASAACFAQHIDPYNIANLAAIFHANNVVPPASWYGHAPVYPPFTLAILAPLTAIPMVQAVYLWIVLSCIALAYATFVLTQVAAESFNLTLPWRLAIIAIFAASPLLSFGLEMCNVSAVVGALGIAAVAGPSDSPRLKALALSLALLLKPHIAIWIVIALLLSRIRPDRALAMRAVALAAIACVSVLLWMAAHHEVLAVMGSYRGMVASEAGSGSMSPTNYEFLAIAGQITSLASLLGYWLRGGLLQGVTIATLMLIAAGLITASRRPYADEGRRLLRICAWSVFGLLATYHRAHDAAFLLLLLPCLLTRLRVRHHDFLAWTALAMLALMGAGPTWEAYESLASSPAFLEIGPLLLFRQSALAALVLLALLVADALRRPHQTAILTESVESEPALAAAA